MAVFFLTKLLIRVIKCVTKAWEVNWEMSIKRMVTLFVEE
jgi:hypothetical protein